MATPVLKPSASWFAPTVNSINRTNITQINFVDSYTPSSTVTDSWDASAAQDGGVMCYVEGTILTIAGNGSGSIKANPDASRMFSYASDTTASDLFSALTTINGLTLLDTSDCTTMERMFRSCTKLTSLDISNFNTSKVKNFYMTFAIMNKLRSLDVSNLDTSACEDMGFMFYGDPFTSLNFENWDVSKVKSFDHFLTSCTSLSNFNVSKWDVSSAENFNAAFHGVPKTSYDLSEWNVSKVKVFSQMFEGNSNLVEIKGLENWNTSNGICFGQMFLDCAALEELDLSSFDTRKAHSGSATSSNGSTSENTKQMLSGMTNLKKVTLGKYFTFLGNGTSNEIGSLPNTADGNWYNIEGVAYAASNIPALTYATYYATAALAQEDLETKKYISYANLKTYHRNLGNFIKSQVAEIKFTEIILTDTVNGNDYVVQMKNGSLITFPVAVSIDLTSLPSKTTYFAGDTVDLSGMTLAATNQDGSLREITDYTYEPSVITKDTTEIVVTYTERGITYTYNIPISVDTTVPDPIQLILNIPIFLEKNRVMK